MDGQPSNFGTNNFTAKEKQTYRHDIAERVIVAIGSFINVLLAFRFIFALLAANPANGFDSFVSALTAPLVSPFYSLFSYSHPRLGAATFEGYTLVAMAVFGLATAGLAKLVTIPRYQ